MSRGSQKSLKDWDAWEIHKEADALLHSRVQGSLIAQAFLGACYAQVVTAFNANRSDAYFWIMLTFILTGLALNFLMSRMNVSIFRGLEEVKPILTSKHKLYGKYYSKVGERQSFLGMSVSKILPSYLSYVVYAFWFSLLALTIWLASTPLPVVAR